MSLYPLVVDIITGKKKVLKNHHLLTTEEKEQLFIETVNETLLSEEEKHVTLPLSLKEFYLEAREEASTLTQVYHFRVKLVDGDYIPFLQSIVFNGNQRTLFLDDDAFAFVEDNGVLLLTVKSVHSQTLTLSINK